MYNFSELFILNSYKEEFIIDNYSINYKLHIAQFPLNNKLNVIKMTKKITKIIKTNINN